MYERVALPGIGKYILVATLSPGCLSCTEEAPQLKVLLDRAPVYGWSALVVSHGQPQDTASFVRSQALGRINWISDPSFVTYNKLGLSAVPQMVVLGTGGVIQATWHGTITDVKAREIEAYMAAHRSAASHVIRPVGKGDN